jgi:hypothetical protein
MRALILALAVALGVDAGAASAACMNPDAEEIAEGRLTVGKFKDADGRPETAFILRLPAPACLDGKGEDDRVKGTRTIHVYSGNAAIQHSLRRLVGKTVLVRGKPFAHHTAHHHAPIVMEVREVDRR